MHEHHSALTMLSVIGCAINYHLIYYYMPPNKQQSDKQLGQRYIVTNLCMRIKHIYRIHVSQGLN